MPLRKRKYVEFNGVSRPPNGRKNETHMTTCSNADSQLRIKWNC